MVNCLLISGSPRKGNTNIILNRVFDRINGEKELVYLKDKHIKHCNGCLSCDKSNKCVIRDDMDELMDKLVLADVIVIGTPNYFDNVPGLLKDFIDRTNPFYETDILNGKKLVTFIVGGGEILNSKRVSDYALTYFSNAHKLDYVGSYCFSALESGAVLDDDSLDEAVDKIVMMIGKI